LAEPSSEEEAEGGLGGSFAFSDEVGKRKSEKGKPLDAGTIADCPDAGKGMFATHLLKFCKPSVDLAKPAKCSSSFCPADDKRAWNRRGQRLQKIESKLQDQGLLKERYQFVVALLY